MSTFYDDGRSIRYGHRRMALEKEFDINILDGFLQMTDFRGYEYKEIFKYSFAQLYQTYGIRQNGEDFAEWETKILNEKQQRKDTIVVFEMSMGNGSPYPEPAGQFDLYLNGEKAVSFTVVKHTEHWIKNDVEFLFDVKKKKCGNYGVCYTMDEWIQNDCLTVNGVGHLKVPTRMLESGKSATIKIVPFNRDVSANWFRIGNVFALMNSDIAGSLEQLVRGRPARKMNGCKVYFGDIHTHSNEGKYLDNWGCGTGSLKKNFEYARDIANLDFFCMSDHDWQLGQEDWDNLRQTNESYNHPGTFATIFGYEWTSNYYGHRNVYFRGDGSDVDYLFDSAKEKQPVRYGAFPDEDDPSPPDLWNWIEANGFEAITVPHHSNTVQFPMNFDRFFNEKYDRAVEIYSCWGDAGDAQNEVTVNNDRFPDLEITRFLNRHKFALIASSDGHNGNPGNANICAKVVQLGHYLGSGKVAVLIDELTREKVYDAIKGRRCYAVTGAPILLSFQVNGTMMGQTFSREEAQSETKIEFEIKGTDKIAAVEIFKNGRRFQAFKDFYSASVKLQWTDDTFDPTEPCNYFIRVTQIDGEMAWSSPIWYET